MTNTIENRMVSAHNWNEFEEVKNDLAKEVLKLRLVYEFIGSKGYTSEADNLLGEAIANTEQYQEAIGLFFECASDGITFNPD